MNHTNRSKTNRCRDVDPTVAETRAARDQAELTQTDAARLLSSTLHAWHRVPPTPGPWKLDGSAIVAGPPRRKVAGVYLCLADGRLMAAAPELLAALQRLCDIGPQRTMTREALDAFDQAHAALATATGKVTDGPGTPGESVPDEITLPLPGL